MTPVIGCWNGWSSKESASQWSSTEATPQPRRLQGSAGVEDSHAELGGGVGSQHDLSAWFGRQGFPRVSPGNHISARAQEFVLGEAVSVDARAALLEAAFVTVTILMGRELSVGGAQRARTNLKEQNQHDATIPLQRAFSLQKCWQQLDPVDLSEAVLLRVPRLRPCPRFLGGRGSTCRRFRKGLVEQPLG